MEQFQSRFLEEATDLIDELEELLLETRLDKLPDDFIEQVFRIMHSLKGSGAMFGFQQVSDFGHNLEDLYDKIRNDELTVTEDILDLTLKSVDLFKGLLHNADDSATLQGVSEITQRVLNIISTNDQGDKHLSKKADINDTSLKTFWVQFLPHKEIFDNGTNPLFVIDELVAIGQSEIIVDTKKVPDFKNFKPTNCYIRWYVLLATSSSEEDLEEVFMFVDDLADINIEKIADRNVLGDGLVLNKVEQARKNLEIIGDGFVEELKEAAKQAMLASEEENIKENLNDFNKRKQLSSIRVAADKIDTYLSLVSELITVQTSLSILGEKLKNDELSSIVEEIEHLSRNLRDNAISISLVPFATIFSRFQRLVHDLSKEFGKEIELKAEGMDTELDKTMIQTITDPLMHIIRNSIDHGIEDPQAREAEGKPAVGTITMRALHSGANILIEVEDDGQGIDPQKIRDAAIRKGFLDSSVQMSDQDTIKLILRPGFSTTEKATSVSGRGVGMDVVFQNVTSLKGALDIESKIGVGTTMRIRLPQSLSILDGMLVNISDTLFVVPSMVLLKIAPINYDELKESENQLLYIDGEHIPFLDLRKEFEIKGDLPERMEIVVLEYESSKVALIVDQVHNEYQVVLRPLGKFLKNNDMLLGASIIGEGNIALVLDTNKIIKQMISKHGN